jgi:hypothetical protein
MCPQVLPWKVVKIKKKTSLKSAMPFVEALSDSEVPAILANARQATKHIDHSTLTKSNAFNQGLMT